jgi:hypothetical protein
MPSRYAPRSDTGRIQMPTLQPMPAVTATVQQDPNEGLRTRKPIDYGRHYQDVLRALLEPGDIILIEPFGTFGHFIVRENLNPDLLVMKSFNIATRFTNPLPAMSTSGSQSETESVVRALDIGTLEFAHWKIMCLDPGFQVRLSQPESVFMFRDRVVRRLSYGNTMYHWEAGEYGMVPEVFTFADWTPIKAVATSTEMNETSYWARMAAVGHKFYLEPVQLNDRQDPYDPRVVGTFFVGEKAGGI